MKRVLAMLQSCVLFALMAATGEGGEKKIPKEFNSENMEATIISKYRDGKPVTPTCSQRMREAMKAMDGSIQAEQRINKNVKGEKVYVLPDDEIYKQWNDTMEACIQ